MSKMTVAEASEYFKVSKEAIHNRIRRGTLDCVIEHGTKYVVVGDVKSEPVQNNAGNDKYYSYIEQENAVLKAKISELEGETRSLREQREQMLIEEKVKIEQIYKERDIQLKSVLQVVASKFLTHQNMEAVIEEAVAAEEAEPFDDVIDVVDEEEDFVSLKQFMKLKMYSKKKRDKIKARFEQYAFDDERILVKKSKIYLKPNHFDYSDLIK
ncbi:MAG: DNA-binding protein [Sulfurimonadaceae bacterium]